MDTAFKPAPFHGHTTRDLMLMVMAGHDFGGHMRVEIERRNRVAAGDKEAMTDRERLRFLKSEEIAR